MRQRATHGIEAFLDALRDRDFAFARQQFDRAHLAHVHAHRVGRAAEFGVDGGRERLRGFLGGFVVGNDRLAHQQRLGVRCLFVHRDAHVVDHLHDVFDLLRIDDLGRQVVVDLGVGEEALFLTAGNQQLELRLPVFRGAGSSEFDLELLRLRLGRLLAGLFDDDGAGAWATGLAGCAAAFVAGVFAAAVFGGCATAGPPRLRVGVLGGACLASACFTEAL